MNDCCHLSLSRKLYDQKQANDYAYLRCKTETHFKTKRLSDFISKDKCFASAGYITT
jgi:hypothetical protein